MATDDEYRDASKRSPDRVTLPKVVQGVRLSSPGEQPLLQSYEQTPPASPEARARARARRDTLLGMGAKPAPSVTLPPPRAPYQGPRTVTPTPFASPAEVAGIRREAARHGDRVIEAPQSIPPPPPPSGFAVDVQAGGQRVRVQAGGSIVRKVWPWLAPVVLSIVGAVVGYAKGYFEGLAAAGRRVAAVEEGLRLNGEDDARRATRVTSDINRAFVVIDDHDARIPKLEKRLNKTEERLPKIEGLPPPK
jgi:hypothetical protein